MPSDTAHSFALLRELEQACGPRVVRLLDRLRRDEARQALVVRLRHLRLAVPVERIAEVVEAPRQLAQVPGTARWVVGLSSHRGDLLPLYDLRTLVFGDCKGSSRRGPVLILPGRHRRFGLLVDELAGLRRFRLQGADGAEQLPAMLAPLAAGLCQAADDILPMVDLAGIERLPAFTDAVQDLEGADP